jgi:hypothetical protein
MDNFYHNGALVGYQQLKRGLAYTPADEKTLNSIRLTDYGFIKNLNNDMKDTIRKTIFEDVAKRFDGSETSMIIDPPRAGCDTKFLEQLIAFAPKKLVYVSCGPDTQARDLAYLTQHGYQIELLQPFDLFPQTRHIENVAVLKLKS